MPERRSKDAQAAGPFAVGSVVSGYEVVEALGQGGFSRIYKARSSEGRLVTLKLPFAEIIGDPAVYERFRREFVIGQKLSHPAIPRAISLNDTPAGPCLVLEYVEGDSLRVRLRNRGPLTAEEAVSIAGQIAEALAYLHSNQVFHRDLKPENVIIRPDGRVCIVDFGIALLKGAKRVTWRALTDALGTPDYMAPEQVQGKRGDARTDIYALGTILYEMLVGRVPYEGDNALSVMEQHLTRSPVPPRKLKPSVPATVEAIVLKALRRDPKERYQTAEALLADLQSYRTLDVSGFSLGPEKPARAVVTDRQVWTMSAIIVGAFLALAGLAVLIVWLVRRG